MANNPFIGGECDVLWKEEQILDHTIQTKTREVPHMRRISDLHLQQKK